MNEALLNEAKTILKPLRHVFLLLPSEDKEESLKICNERLKGFRGRDLEPMEIEAKRDFIYGESNYQLAKEIIYTKEKSRSVIAMEISARISFC